MHTPLLFFAMFLAVLGQSTEIFFAGMQKFFMEDCDLLTGVFSVSLGTTLYAIVQTGKRRENPLRITDKRSNAISGVISILMATSHLYLLSVMNVFDLQAIFMTKSALIVLSGALFLGEGLSPWKMGAVTICFLGAAAITQSTPPELAWASALAMLHVVMIVIRVLARKVASRTTSGSLALFWDTIPKFVLFLPVWFIFGEHPISLGLVAIGLTFGFAKSIYFWSLKHITISIAGALSFSGLVVAMAFDYFMFDNTPNTLALTGAGLISLGVAMHLYKEHQQARRAELVRG